MNLCNAMSEHSLDYMDKDVMDGKYSKLMHARSFLPV
jgi:hypothetical protein